MELQDFLRRLQGVRGPSPSGDYVARCPAHEDTTASLCVANGEKGIIFKCQAGCTKESVLQALGMQVKDLISPEWAAKSKEEKARSNNASSSRGKYAASGKAQKPPIKAAPAKTDGQGEKKSSGLGEIECTYSYTDEGGHELFQVVRFRQEDGKKTFRQRRYEPTSPSAKQGGWVWSVDGVRLVVYRLPEVREAVAEDRPIFIVEGEKDCDTMAALGYVATTCPMGAGKWCEDYTRQLAGAGAVYVIPDNDGPDQKFAGQKHGWDVARALAPVAREVRQLDLTTVCPELKIKGDITDMMELMGSELGVPALERLMAATEALDRQEIEDLNAATAYYNRVSGYCIDGGCICTAGDPNQGTSPKKLANFVALPRAVVTRDDGINTEKVMVISGWKQNGFPLPRARVPMKNFGGMAWVAECWDFAANMMPGTTTKDKLRYVIAEVGNMTAKRSIEYTHSGWRKIGGKWAYLYQGGAIGAERVTVDLGQGMGRYGLGGKCTALDLREAAETSYGLLFAMDEAVAVPLLGVVYLAPLREFLSQTGNDPAFSLFLIGGTGTRKSTAAALALSHFGDFNSRSLPASFNDTANYIRSKAFKLKDCLIVVDDYHPVTSLQERKKMESIAQSLSRAFGDLAERGRMNADRSLQESNPPRSLAIISGEDMPAIGQSGMSRYFVVNVGDKSVPPTNELTGLQLKARAGYLRRAMRSYIEWLLPQAEELPDMLEREWQALRVKAAESCQGQHGRSPEAIAHMMLGYGMMMRYLVSVGVFDGESARSETARAWSIITESSRRQGEEMREERPSRMFVDALGELLTAKTALLQDLTDASATTPIRGMAGYMDGQNYYFLPDLAYGMVAKLYNDQGLAFPLSKRMLYKQMKDDGLLTPDVTGSKSTRVRNIAGKSVRLLWIPRENLDGPSTKVSQQKMDLRSGYMVVNEPMPFDEPKK